MADVVSGSKRSHRSTRFSFAASPQLAAYVTAARSCRSTHELSALTIDHIPVLLGTNACGVLLADATGKTAEATITGMPDRDFDAYDNIWRPRDRVFTTLLERQVTVLRREVWTDAEWRQDPIYSEFARRIELFEYLSSPLYGCDGRLLGVVNFCRPERRPAFGAAESRLATAMAGYLSAGFARITAGTLGVVPPHAVALTPREHEVAALVAQGMNNLEIAMTLQIARETVKQTLRRVYRKLDVNGRAQMVARLAELRST